MPFVCYNQINLKCILRISVKDLEVKSLIKRSLWQYALVCFLMASTCFSMTVQAEEVQYESKQESVLFKKEKKTFQGTINQQGYQQQTITPVGQYNVAHMKKEKWVFQHKGQNKGHLAAKIAK